MNDFLTAILGSSAYSVFGFLCGWLLGHEARILREVQGAVTGNESSEIYTDHRRKGPWYSSLGVFLVLLASFTVLQSAYFTFQQREATSCLTEYNEDFAVVAQLRSDWVEEDRLALVEFFHTYDSGASERVRDQSFANLMRTFERNGEKRASTPLPALENCE